MGLITLRPVSTFNDPSPPFLRMGGTSFAGVLADEDNGTYVYEQNRSAYVIGFGATLPQMPAIPAGAIIERVTPRVVLWANGVGPASDGSGQGGMEFRLVGAYGGAQTANFVVPNAVNTTYVGASETRDEFGNPWTPAAVSGTHVRLSMKGAYVEARFVAAYVDVVYNEAPTAQATGSGSVITTRPTLTHTYSDPEGVAQQLFRWKIFDAATYGAAGFDPNTSTAAVYDSGIQAGAATSLQVPIDLLNGTTYRAFIWVSDTSSGHWNIVTASAGPYRQFTISLDPPAVPTVSTSLDTPGNAVTVTVQGRDNVLAADEATFEAGIGTWAGVTNATVARSTSFGMHGTASLAITAVAAGTALVRTATGAAGKPVMPNTTYFGQAVVRSGASGRNYFLTVYWYKSDGTPSATPSTVVQGTDMTPGGWTTTGATVTSPADAAFAAVAVELTGQTAGEVSHLDRVSLAPGNSPVWTIGGLLPSQRFWVERSLDGGATWHRFRGLASTGTGWVMAETVDASDASQTLIVKDYEATRGTAAVYRARTTATVLGQTVASGWSTASGPQTIPGTDWWLKDILDPANNIKMNALGPELVMTSDEDQQVLYPLGRENAVVVSGSVHGEQFPLELYFRTEAEFQAFEKLRRRQVPLLLQTPNESMYVRLGASREKIRKWGDARLARVSVIEVDSPLVV